MIPFTKMHGIGNDFVVLNGYELDLPEDAWPDLAREMCDRRFGVGSDGLIVVREGTLAKVEMLMLNPDGSPGGMCGNGTRCVYLWLLNHGMAQRGEALDLQVGSRLTRLEGLPDGRVRVDMGEPGLTRADVGMVGAQDEPFVDRGLDLGSVTIIGTAVSFGNPHFVAFVTDVDAVDLMRVGPQIERHPAFPLRTNVHFAQVVDKTHLRMRTWERGAGATLACGSGACAVTAAGVLTQRSLREIELVLPGGTLHMEYRADGKTLMTGEAEQSFTGRWWSSPVASAHPGRAVVG